MKRTLISATLLALVASSTVALASGSTGRGTAGNDWGTTVRKGNNSLISNENRLVSQGRAQVRRYITCKSCEYHNKLNRETAPEVAQAVRAGRFEIKGNRRNAVLAYIKKRYGI
ncbi:MAG: hypothetical protein ABJP02_07950 [Parasphingorhabdus sp.]|uniref:hypothetical protein n=1 Tax=Parasphingorhabdus sp. TaxID=2709688 RepID=UPI003297534B